MTFDFTLPGYNYCGPGTKTKTAVPVNLLDEHCREHDQFYERHKEKKKRQLADIILAKLAWKRVNSVDAGMGERFVAFIVYGMMVLKSRIYKWGLFVTT